MQKLRQGDWVRTSSLFKKDSYEVKASGLQFQYIWIILNLSHNENKLYKTLDIDPEIRSILIL